MTTYIIYMTTYIMYIKEQLWTLLHMDREIEKHTQCSNKLVTELLKRVVECVNTHVSECTQRIMDAIGHTHLETQKTTIDQLQNEMSDLITSINMANGKISKLSGTVTTMRAGLTEAIADLNTVHRRYSV